MKTAVIYARYSSERQTEQSIEGQLRVCQEYAKRENISLSSDTSLPMFILTFNILRISLRTSGAVLTKLVIIKYKYIIVSKILIQTMMIVIVSSEPSNMVIGF